MEPTGTGGSAAFAKDALTGGDRANGPANEVKYLQAVHVLVADRRFVRGNLPFHSERIIEGIPGCVVRSDADAVAAVGRDDGRRRPGRAVCRGTQQAIAVFGAAE